jgi:hypothetical protein
MGSKDKLWLEGNGGYWLFKYPREGTGEHWAEKVAEVIAAQLGIPCAEIQLARREEVIGTISRRFVTGDETLVHGNELMAGYVPGYDPGVRFKQREHRVDSILECVNRVASVGPRCESDPVRVMIGYLVLDALIGNTDRHHENWGVIDAPGHDRRLAPTYDHASSLGRELSDRKRRQRLEHWGAAHYLYRGKGAVYLCDGTIAPPFGVMEELRTIGYDAEVEFWRAKLLNLGHEAILGVCDSVPSICMSDAAKAFARAVIEQSFVWLRDGMER